MKSVVLVAVLLVGGCAAEVGGGEVAAPVATSSPTVAPEPSPTPTVREQTATNAEVICEQFIRDNVTQLADFVPSDQYETTEVEDQEWLVLGAYDNTASGERVDWQCEAEWVASDDEWQVSVGPPEP